VKPYKTAVLLSKVRVFLELAQTHSELVEKVDALAASEERYRSLVATIPDIVYRVDTEGRFTYLNEAIHSLGYTKEDLLGSHFSEIVLPADVDNVSRELVLPRYHGSNTGPEEAPKLLDERRTGKRKTTGLDVRLVSRRGDRAVPAELHSGGPGVVMVEINSSGVYAGTADGTKTVFLGTVGIIRDITDRKRDEEELKKHRENLEKLVRKRVKEINCLYTISSLVAAPCDDMDRVLKEVVNLIPAGFQHPEITCAKIALEGREFFTSNFRETQWQLCSDIPVPHSDSPVGNFVQVFSLEDKDGRHQDHFLEEERNLIEDIGRQLGVVAQREHSIRDLRRIEWLLSKVQEAHDGTDGMGKEYQPPYGDLLALNTSRLILDSVGKEMLTDIVNDYLDLLDTSAAVYEKNGDYALGIFSSGWCRFMDAASRAVCRTEDNRTALDCGRWHCHESCWTDAAKAAMQTGAPVDIACKGGIRLYAVPVLAGNEIIGAINFGYGDPPKDESRLQELAAEFEVSVEDLRAHARAYPSRPPYIIDLAKRRLAASARLIGEIVRRKKTEEREGHLSLVLRAIRDVNQLIVKEKRPDVLIQEACNTLARTRGFLGAWIALTPAAPGTVKTAQTGFDSASFEAFAEAFQTGDLPACCRRSREEGCTVLSTPDHSGECGDCPLSDSYAGNSAMTIELRYGNQYYGCLGISVPPEFAADADEVSLAEEIGGDIAFALYGIEMIEKEKQVEDALRESEERYERVIRGTNDGVWEWDVVANQVFFSERWKSMIGYKDHEVKNDFSEWENRIHPDDMDRCRKYIERHLASQNELFELEHRLRHKDGSYVWILARALTVRDDEGKPILLTGSHTDLSKRKKAEIKLRESEEFNRSIIENSMDCIKILDLDGNMKFMSKGGQQILEIDDINTFLNKSWIDFWKDEDHTNAREAIETAKAGKMGYFEGYSPTAKGTPKWWSVQISPIYGSTGNIKELLSVSRDITEQKSMKDQYIQSQKMESIGTLAGGIAHDFNNILTAIIGNANLALMEVDEDGPLREEIEEIKTAGERAASLTRQLLAFSRKEIIQPRILDLNKLVTDIEKMLGRLIGEDIELLTILEPALWRVEADPGQVEQVIMNLAVNARDAMPKGGKLTIETANVDLDRNYYRKHGIKEEQSGSYVMLAVSDTGIGMNEETRKRIFEPFFTTKGIDKGTGLGLSSVYGIVMQNNGFIWVYSEPGQGTTFKIYLPRNMGEPEPKDKEQTPVGGLDGSETVLVVEDDNPLRKLARTVLKQKGYKVLEAENGEDAFRVAEAYDGSIDLLITDVVMPKMGGRKTAERLQPLYPQMKVIYMSGYTDNAIVHHGVLEPGLNFIEKPFSPKALARKVREVLDGRTEN